MIKSVLTIILTLFFLTNSAQTDLSLHLEKNKYSFTLEKGFEKNDLDILKNKFKNYKLILQAEGGSHYLKFYSKLHLLWTKTLSENLGVKNLFFEFGAPAATCVNKYLDTGDSTKLYNSLSLGDKPNMKLWKPFYELNKNLNSKLTFFGVDFNRTSSYLKALKLLMPTNLPNDTIRNAINLINSGDEKNTDCSYIQKINKKIENELKLYPIEFKNYFGSNYYDFERIIMNKGTCNDEHKNRNYNMVDNFLNFDNYINEKIYYGELGMAHTILKNKVFASILNKTEKFKDKVCVINLYCYNCTTPEEKVSNYPLSGIEQEILNNFIPLCNTDFTIFDLSSDSKLTNKFKEYGQFLIVVKNQN